MLTLKMRMAYMYTYFFSVFGGSIFFWSVFCSGSDAITASESLFPNQTIISKDGKFELGFFVPGNSTNYYIGIWYRNIPTRTVVWVLNRNTPIPHSYYNYSQLEISNGTLLLRSGLDIFWAYNGTLNATEAVIQDNGNFVLRNASGILWQSFEHPTDTWLPGAKLEYHWFADVEAKLVSWRNPYDPASGIFSLVGGNELSIMANDRQMLWRSGVWVQGTFDKSDFSDSYKFTYLQHGSNIYLTYNAHNESILSRIVIDYMGRVMQYRWSEGRQVWVRLMVQPSSCSADALCGPNTICNINYSKPCRCLSRFQPQVDGEWDSSNYSSGCIRRRPLQCAEKVGYIKVTSNGLPANHESADLPTNACELFCSRNCSCSAYAYGDGGECLLFVGDLLALDTPRKNSVGVDVYVKVKSKGKRKVLLLALLVPITAVVLISCFGFSYLWPKLKLKHTKSKETHQNLLLLDLDSEGPACKKRDQVDNSHEEEKNNQNELPIFSFSSIVALTNNFSITNKLGEGGFGPVYKGELHNKQFVAVKRLSKRSGQGLEEFRNEIELIAKLQHRNLVGILGCCIENEEKILVYEYMSNKSLDFFIFDETRKDMMDWTKRVHIISGIAQGLLYLHHYSRLRIVHRDLKASNVLLDSEMNPKISDFGMARIFGGNDSQANTERIVGTYGYMSPEYAMEGLFSVKSDVFAFGVLMLEIISGKKNTGFYGSNYLSLLGYAWNMWKEERVLELVDPILEIPAASSSSAAALRYIKIGLLCVQENPVDRPLMSDVVDMLNSEDAKIPTPMNPAFTVTRTSATPHKLQICSVNGLTLSHVEPR